MLVARKYFFTQRRSKLQNSRPQDVVITLVSMASEEDGPLEAIASLDGNVSLCLSSPPDEGAYRPPGMRAGLEGIPKEAVRKLQPYIQGERFVEPLRQAPNIWNGRQGGSSEV